MSQRVTLVLSDEALAVINANATERKRGEFVSNVLLDYAKEAGEISAGSGDNDGGILERIDQRLVRIERRLGLMPVGKL